MADTVPLSSIMGWPQPAGPPAIGDPFTLARLGQTVPQPADPQAQATSAASALVSALIPESMKSPSAETWADFNRKLSGYVQSERPGKMNLPDIGQDPAATLGRGIAEGIGLFGGAPAEGVGMKLAAGLIPMAKAALRAGAGEAERGVAEAAAPKVAQGIRAYHGSPHDFERFDLSKIGTGEGAQAYGHGLYFAENPKTARAYEGMLARNGYDPAVLARDNLMDYGPDDGIKALRDRAEATKHLDPIFSANAEEAIKLIEAHKVGSALPLPAKGRMYEVNINANPEHFLDWDKPLSEQHPQIQEAVNKTGYPGGNITGQDYYRQLGIHNLMEGKIPPNDRGAQYRSSAESLRQAGIPGIKYLDQGSRGSGIGTSNYVLFDDKLIDIVKKYGMAGLGMYFGSRGAMQPQGQAQ